MTTNVKLKCPSCGCENFRSAGEAEPGLDDKLTCVDCGRVTTQRKLATDLSAKMVKDGLKDLKLPGVKIKF